MHTRLFFFSLVFDTTSLPPSPPKKKHNPFQIKKGSSTFSRKTVRRKMFLASLRNRSSNLPSTATTERSLRMGRRGRGRPLPLQVVLKGTVFLSPTTTSFCQNSPMPSSIVLLGAMLTSQYVFMLTRAIHCGRHRAMHRSPPGTLTAGSSPGHYRTCLIK